MKLTVPHWLIGGIALFALAGTVVGKQHNSAQKYQNHRAEYCAALTGTIDQKKACIEEYASAKNYLPWWWDLIGWPGAIETWAIIITGFYIGVQAYETRKSAAATEKSAAATEKAAIATESSVAVARRQIEMTKDKERARIEVRADLLALREYPSFWYITAIINVRNLGPSRGHISYFQAELVWSDSESPDPTPAFSQQGNIYADSYVDSTENWSEEGSPEINNFATDLLNKDEMADRIFNGRMRVILRGALTYATVGTAYQRFFCFEWKGSGRPDSAFGLYGTPPTTNVEKVSKGYWESTMNIEVEPEQQSGA
jgi:hypothetical protein